MIYTIGHAINYERYFIEQGADNVKKKGADPSENYDGGCVWKTRKEAENFTKGGQYKVYGVLADWENDTVKYEEDEFNRLLVDSVLVQLE